MHEELINAPLIEALKRLKGRDVFVRVLTPPYPAAGKGQLRVVRIEYLADERNSGGQDRRELRSGATGQDRQRERLELIATYDDYEKLPGPPAQARKKP